MAGVVVLRASGPDDRPVKAGFEGLEIKGVGGVGPSDEGFHGVLLFGVVVCWGCAPMVEPSGVVGSGQASRPRHGHPSMTRVTSVFGHARALSRVHRAEADLAFDGARRSRREGPGLPEADGDDDP